MGQQQLLLLILVTVVVGIMTISGIILFERARDNSIEDMIRQDMYEAATIGQLYFRRPSAFGGGDGSFTGISMDIIQLDTATAVSRFSITETTNSYFKITANYSSKSTYRITIKSRFKAL